MGFPTRSENEKAQKLYLACIFRYLTFQKKILESTLVKIFAQSGQYQIE